MTEKKSVEATFAEIKMKAVSSLMAQEGAESFAQACHEARTPMTRRQARKWLQNRGLAFSTRESLLRKAGL